MSAFTSLLPSILPVLVMIASAFAPQMQGMISAHPLIAAVVASLGAILNHWLPSPKA